MLVMSLGYITFASRTGLVEGLEKVTAIRYCARMRFLINLLPFLNAATSPRALSVLATDMEGQLWPQGFSFKEKAHYSVMKAGGAVASMTTLFLEE